MNLSNQLIKKEYENFFEKGNNGDMIDLLTESKNDSVFMKGELIIKFIENITLDFTKTTKGIVTGVKSLDKLNDKYTARSIKKIFPKTCSGSFSNIYKFYFSDEIDISQTVESYKQLSIVEYAEPNYVYSYCIDANDPLFSQQWSLKNIGQIYPWDGRFNPPPGNFDCDIDVTEAWNTTTGEDNIVIAVIDSGIDYKHIDISNNIWFNSDEIPKNGKDDDENGYIDDYIGWDFQDNDNNPIDEYGHGTFCAGVIGAVGNNSKGVVGVCWNCKIMPIRCLLTSEMLANAILYATNNGADVISMSYGGYSYSQLQKDMVDYAYNRNVVLIASAGNDNISRIHYPSGYENVISVAATNSRDGKAIFSNYGPMVDVGAPGVDVLSLRAENTDMYEDMIHIIDQKYYIGSGTSMAAPCVAGIAALLLSKNSSLTPDMIRTIISNSVDDVCSSNYYIGGRVNAYKALQKKPAIAILQQFSEWRDVKGSVDIKGKISGEDFDYYILEYGKGINPNEWLTIIDGGSPKEGVIAKFDTTKVDEGLSSVRLTVYCNNDTYEDRIWLIVNNKQNTIYVDDDNKNGPWDGSIEYPYKRIQEAVNWAGDGDIVFVYNGIYYESVNIETAITLIGENSSTTIIDSDKNGSNIQILSNSIKLEGFTIQNSRKSIEEAGIKFGTDIKNVVIKNNIIQDCYIGVCLVQKDTNNEISGNIIYNSTILLLWGSMSNTISDNFISKSEGGVGIGLSMSYFNAIANNTIMNHKYGIFIGFSIKNLIQNNNITNNDIGLLFFIWGLHKIENNNFINNRIHAFFIGSRYNIWKGNYWDNWIGLKRPILRVFPKYIPGFMPGIIRSFDRKPAIIPYNI